MFKIVLKNLRSFVFLGKLNFPIKRRKRQSSFSEVPRMYREVRIENDDGSRNVVEKYISSQVINLPFLNTL